MHLFNVFVVFLTWLASVRLEDPSQPQFVAKATVSLGKPKLFSGEDVQLDCNVPDDHSSSWLYRWFRDGVPLSSNKVYSIKKARVQQSGSYTCQGRKQIKTWPYSIMTNPSDPLKIHVNGGWVLLQTPSESHISDEPMTLTCRIRDNPLLLNVIFYKDDMMIKTQNDNDLVIPSLSIEDDGMYSCRATWLNNLMYQSAQSVPFSVTVLEKLETPRLVPDQDQVRIGTQVVFSCIAKVNSRVQGLSVEYYYVKDDNRLAPASSKDTYVISRVNEEDAGNYTCKVRVRALNVERWSNLVQLKVLPF